MMLNNAFARLEARADASGISLRPASNVVLLPGRTRLTVARRLKPSRASAV